MYAIYNHITVFRGQRFFSETARLTAGHETIVFHGIIIFITVLKKKPFPSNVISVHSFISMILGYSSDVFISYFPNKVFKIFPICPPPPMCVTLLFFSILNDLTVLIAGLVYKLWKCSLGCVICVSYQYIQLLQYGRYATCSLYFTTDGSTQNRFTLYEVDWITQA